MAGQTLKERARQIMIKFVAAKHAAAPAIYREGTAAAKQERLQYFVVRDQAISPMPK